NRRTSSAPVATASVRAWRPRAAARFWPRATPKAGRSCRPERRQPGTRHDTAGGARARPDGPGHGHASGGFRLPDADETRRLPPRRAGAPAGDAGLPPPGAAAPARRGRPGRDPGGVHLFEEARQRGRPQPRQAAPARDRPRHPAPSRPPRLGLCPRRPPRGDGGPRFRRDEGRPHARTRPHPRPEGMSPLAHVVALPVRAYRLILSPWVGHSCRYQPTCSAYAIEALEKHGAVKGSWLAL